MEMKRKVKYADALSALRQTRPYGYGEVFETGSGEFAVIWRNHPIVNVILPAEWEVNEWGELIDPFSIAREKDTNPLLTESNLEFDGKMVFNWCKFAANPDSNPGSQLWLQLCEPQDATHILVYNFRKVIGRPLAADDTGKLSLGDYYHEGESESTLLLPVGYVRLSYQAKDTEGYTTRFTYGASQDMLQKYFALRAQEPQKKAQEKLDAQRSAREERAKEIAAVKKFIADHAEELNNLQEQRNVLASRAGLLNAKSDCDGNQFTDEIRIEINKTSANGLKMWGYGQAFDFSEQGIKDFLELIQSKRRDLEDRLTQQRKEHSWKEEMFVKMRLLSKAVADRHVCVYEGADSLYFSHEHGNYRSIRLFLIRIPSVYGLNQTTLRIKAIN